MIAAPIAKMTPSCTDVCAGVVRDGGVMEENGSPTPCGDAVPPIAGYHRMRSRNRSDVDGTAGPSLNTVTGIAPYLGGHPQGERTVAANSSPIETVAAQDQFGGCLRSGCAKESRAARIDQYSPSPVICCRDVADNPSVPRGSGKGSVGPNLNPVRPVVVEGPCKALASRRGGQTRLNCRLLTDRPRHPVTRRLNDRAFTKLGRGAIVQH